MKMGQRHLVRMFSAINIYFHPKYKFISQLLLFLAACFASSNYLAEIATLNLHGSSMC
jgi:hypothetical protein